MRYNPSISMTQPSCNDPRLPRPLEGPISEGCECEDGFLFNPGPNTCVPPEECGCSLPTGYVAVGNTPSYYQNMCFTRKMRLSLPTGY